MDSRGGPARAPGRLRAFLTPRAEDTGVVAAAPAVPPRELLRRFWPFARPSRKAIAAGIVFVALLPAVQTAEIWLFKVVVDDVIVPGELGPLVWIGAAVLGLTLLGAALSFAEDYAWTSAGERFLLDLRATFFERLQGLSSVTLDRRRLGDLLARLGGDVQAIEGFVLGGLGEAISAVARIGFFAGALFLLDWQLALAALVLGPPFALATRHFARLARVAAREKRRRSGALTAVAEEGIANAALVQSHNRGHSERDRLVREGEGVVDAELASARVGGVFAAVFALIEVTAVLAVVAFGTWAVQEGRLTVGGLLAFMAYLTQLLRPIGDLGHLASSLLAASAGAERVLELLDRRPDVRERPDPVRIGRSHGAVELDDVTYSYPDAVEPVLRGLSLRADPGEIVAIAGPTGAGKSTVARLLVRFADPRAGVVRLDGRDLRELSLADLRDNVGLLLQETLLFDASVRDNIAFGRPSASSADIHAAARVAGAHAFITALPEAYETRVGQRGRRLSGGQRRRVEIARTLLRDTPVVVLDEPTTGLDAEAAARVAGPLRELLRGRTGILITHDPLLLGFADRVVRIDGGRAVERPEALA